MIPGNDTHDLNDTKRPLDGSPAAPIDAEAQVLPAAGKRGRTGKNWPPAFIQNCKALFIAGVSLAQIAVQQDVPFATLARWSSQNEWSKAVQLVRDSADKVADSKMVKWLAEQREAHTKGTAQLGADLRAAIEYALKDKAGNVREDLEPGDIRDLVNSAERLDQLIRRNLGMDCGTSNTGDGKRIAIMANSLTIGATAG